MGVLLKIPSVRAADLERCLFDRWEIALRLNQELHEPTAVRKGKSSRYIHFFSEISDGGEWIERSGERTPIPPLGERKSA
jgi:hypothetical protein